MAKTGEMDKVEKVVEEAVQRALSASEPSTVGRTPWDALTEITGSVLKLLGEWTLPILFVGLIAVGWYFQQEQNQRKSAQYEADLKTLRAERDVAYQRISQFNEEIASVSGQQIKNLTDAFDSLKRINAESVEQQKIAFAMEREAENTAEAMERQAQDAAEALEEAETELRAARTEILEGQKKLEENQKQLEAAQRELQNRVTEVERKEADLTLRGGRIGELQDQLRALQESSESYVTNLEQQRETLKTNVVELEIALGQLRDGLAEESDELAVAPNLEPVLTPDYSETEDAYKSTLAAVRDMTVDLDAVLTPLTRFEGWGLENNYADGLVGLTTGRLEELLMAADGFGFDFWRQLSGGGPSEESYLGVVVNPPRMRLVLLHGSDEGSQERRVTETETYEALLPAVGIVDNAFEQYVLLTFVEEAGADSEEEFWRDTKINEKIPFESVLPNQTTFGDFAVGGEALVPELKEAQFRALLDSRALPLEAERELQSPDSDLNMMFAATAALNAGTFDYPEALDVIPIPRLRDMLRDQVERGVSRAMKLPGASHRRNTDLPEQQLGSLIAMALRPDFTVESQESLNCSDRLVKGSEPGDTVSDCWPLVMIFAELELIDWLLTLRFEDRSRTGDWKYVDGLF